MLDILQQLPWLFRCLIVCAGMLGAAACCYHARHLPPGYPRLLSTLPALVAMHTLPLLFDFRHEPLAATSAAFLCARLTVGKVLAFILGRGALTLPLTFVQFAAVLLAPFMPAELAASRVQPGSGSSSNTAAGAAVAAAAQQGASLSTQQPDPAAAAAPPAVFDAAPSSLLVNPFMLKDLNLPHLAPSFWQRVSPMQRFSIDSSSSSSRNSSSGSRPASPAPSLLDSSSPLDSPRIAAVHQPQQQQDALCCDGVGGDSSGGSTPAAAAATAPTQHNADNCAPPAAATGVPAKHHSKPTPSKRSMAPSRFASTTSSSTPTNRTSNSNPGARALLLPAAAAGPLSLLLNAAVAAAFALYCCHSAAALCRVAVQLGGMWVMWRAMEVMLCAASHPARQYLGVRLAPHFVNPFASTSLTDFWARRWNITQGLVLRFYVYEPIVQGCLLAPPAQPPAAPAAAVPNSNAGSSSTAGPPASSRDSNPQQQWSKPPSGSSSSSSTALKHRRPSSKAAAAGAGSEGNPAAGAPARDATSPSSAAAATLAGPSAAVAPRWRRQLAAAATFVVSGVEHEVFLWYLTRTWGWHWLGFFSLQGLLLAAEGRIKRAARAAGLALHPFVSHLAVLLVLGVAADALFWPPLVQPAIVQPLLQALGPLRDTLGLL